MAYIDPSAAAFVQTPGNDLQRTDNTTLQSMWLRLATRRGSCFWDPDFGSRLHELVATKIGANVERVVVGHVEQALQPMTDAGELLDLEVAAQRVGRNRVEMVLRAFDAGLRPLEFTHFVRVG